MRRIPRGFTLIEMMAAVGIMAILVAVAAYGLSDASRRARLSGAKFTTINTLNFAKQRALSRGVDVYVIFSNLDSTATWSTLANKANAARVLVYEDANGDLRDATRLDDIMTNVVEANIRDEYTSGATSFGDTGFAYVDRTGQAVSACPADNVPPYITLHPNRETTQNCTAFCTFCEVQNGQCIGAIRFSSNGTARIVTGPSGTGGLLKLVSPDDRHRSACIAIAEPSGLAVMVEEANL